MLRRGLMTIAVFLLVLVGCGMKNHTFSGESENWLAELEIRQTDDFEEQDFMLRYKGEDAESVDTFTYHIDTNAGGSSGSGITLADNGVYEDKGGSCRGCAFVRENSEIIVTVEWSGQTESFSLYNE